MTQRARVLEGPGEWPGRVGSLVVEDRHFSFQAKTPYPGIEGATMEVGTSGWARMVEQTDRTVEFSDDEGEPWVFVYEPQEAPGEA